MTHETWENLRKSLPEGISSEMLELVRRTTAPSRHAARVGQAVDALLDATADPDSAARAAESAEDRRVLRVYLTGDYSGLPSHAHAWAVRALTMLRLEMRGVGGHYGAGGDSAATVRMSWARGLGHGRRRAGDGGAWDAALVAVHDLLVEAVGGACGPDTEWVRLQDLCTTVLSADDLPWVESAVRYHIRDLALERPTGWEGEVWSWDSLWQIAREMMCPSEC